MPCEANPPYTHLYLLVSNRGIVSTGCRRGRCGDSAGRPLEASDHLLI
jgi:hypothetical protein